MSSSSDNLKNLERTGALRPDPISKLELQGYLTNAALCLKDGKNLQDSAATRFGLAYTTAHALALAALRAHGYRPVRGTPGHRAIVFLTLPHTVGADAKVWRSLREAHDKRNKSEYEGLVNASEREAADLVTVAERLSQLVRDWLAANRPDLL